jgi:hypothetical protein
MKLFGSLKELVSVVFREDSQEVTLRPNQSTTYSASRDIQLPPGDTAHVIVSASSTQTLTNKTLTSPVINTPTGIVKGDVGLGNVDNTSDATKNAASVTLTNKTLTSPVINTPTGIVKGDVGLGNVDNTSDATKNAASVTLTNKTLTAPVLTSPVIDTGVSGTAVLDEDDMVSNSATKLATQQSIKAYVDAAIAGVAASSESLHTVSDADYTVTDVDGFTCIEFLSLTSARTATLPTLGDNQGRKIRFVKVSGASTLTLEGEGAETVGGDPNKKLVDIGDFIEVQAGTTGWQVTAMGGTIYSSIRVDTGAGHGDGSNDKIREFTNTAETVGTAISLTQNSTVGSVFTINRDGIYAISYQDYKTTADTVIGISKNSNQLTTSIASITAAHCLIAHPFESDSGSSSGFCSWSGKLVSGDVIRPHTNGNTDGTTAPLSKFVVTQVQKL